jgi:Glycosyltransferase family 87
MPEPRRALACAAAILAFGAAPAAHATGTANAGTGAATADPNALVRPTQLTVVPALHKLTPKRALAIAHAVPKIRAMLPHHPGWHAEAYEKGTTRWQVSYFAPGKVRKEIGQVTIDDASHAVVEAWTGYQVPWAMARGYPGEFGRIVNSVWIWIPLSILFVVPFVDPRRWRSWRHLDLIALSSFSVSLAFFNHANIGMSVPLAYPALVYLLVRMLAIALGRGPAPPFRPLVPVAWLAVATVFLIGFRVGLNAESSNVIDVGYAGVIGADRLSHGQPLYGHFPSDNAHGDTYGPVVYEVYLPFEQLEPWHGTWDDLPAAHVAAVVFDLLCILLLFLIGRQVRGPDLGILLAYAWSAFPFTLFTANSNSNDALVGALVLLAVLTARRPAARGAATALAGLTKFAPLALAPVLATHGLRPGRRAAGLIVFWVAFALAGVIAGLPVLLNEDLSTFYDHTISYQASRGSPFSIWGLYGWGGAQSAVQVLGVLVAVGLAFVPRRQDPAGLAAACAGVLLVLQLGVTHWFYLYIPWFFGLVMLAVLGRPAAAEAATAP